MAFCVLTTTPPPVITATGDIVTIEYKSSFVDVKGEVSTVDVRTRPRRAPLAVLVPIPIPVINSLRLLNRSPAQADDDPNEPISFEVGAGDIMGNALFQAFDEAVRGMCVGDTAVVKAKAGASARGRPRPRHSRAFYFIV